MEGQAAKSEDQSTLEAISKKRNLKREIREVENGFIVSGNYVEGEKVFTNLDEALEEIKNYFIKN